MTSAEIKRRPLWREPTTSLFSVAVTFAAWKALVGRRSSDVDGDDESAGDADDVGPEAAVGVAPDDAAGTDRLPGEGPLTPGYGDGFGPPGSFGNDEHGPGPAPPPGDGGDVAGLGPDDYDRGGLGPQTAPWHGGEVAGINPASLGDSVASSSLPFSPLGIAGASIFDSLIVFGGGSPAGYGTNLMVGSTGNDHLVGTEGRDRIEGYEGDDTLIGLGSDDDLYGGEGNDLLDGGAGWDLLDGGLGADEMRGGSGHDFYEVDDVHDRVVEQADDGIDVIRTSVDLTGPLPLHVEALMLAGAAVSGTGNDADNVIVGNEAANVLYGGGGGDWLDGGSGADTLAGGSGDDVYVVDHADDVVTEGRDAGIDTVFASDDHVLAENVENLRLTDPFVTTSRFSELTEREPAVGERSSFISGDILYHYSIIDIYRLPFYAFNVWENLFTVRRIIDARYDVVISGTGNELNNTIIGTAAYTDYVLSGGGGADTLIGNDGDDTLDGGTGADTMIGGPGSDTYVVDEVGDIVIEYEGAGIDSVWASIDYVLGAHLENLELAGAARTGTGNDLGNTIIGTVAGMDYVLSGFGGRDILVGNTGDDILDGGRGADILRGGASDDWLDGGPDGDSLEGGDGDDTFIVDHHLDVVVELAGGGSDTVWASVNRNTLDAHVEDLVLTGNATNGTGNDLDNRITGTVAGVRYTLSGLGGDDTLVGNDADDRLDGGQGADVLIGGAGADTFVLSWDPGDDIIVDFTPGEDRIEIPSVLFGESEGTLEQDGEDVVVRFGSEASIRLENVTLSDLAERDFRAEWGVRLEGNTLKVVRPRFDEIKLVPDPPDPFFVFHGVAQVSDPPALPSPGWPVGLPWDFWSGDGAASWNVVIVGEFYESDILMGNMPPQLVSILAPYVADGSLSLSANTTVTFHEVWLAADGLIADEDVVHPTFVMETYYDL